MKKVGVAAAFIVFGLVIYVMAKGFGTDPHAVPFMMSGKPAPDFTMKRLDNGEPVKFSSFAGKPVVLNFWATWCGPCKLEQPVIEWGAKRYKDEVVFLGVVFEDSEENTKAYLASRPRAEILQLYDPLSTVAVDYAVAGVPETYFVNRQGVIVGKVAEPIDPQTLQTRVAEILK